MISTLVNIVVGLTAMAGTLQVTPQDYCLTHWIYDAQAMSRAGAWYPPARAHAVGVLDLRGRDPASRDPANPPGLVLVTYDEPGHCVGGGVAIGFGTDLDDPLAALERFAITQETGIAPIRATTPREFFLDLVSIHSDPTGESFLRTFGVGEDMTLRLHMGTETLERVINPFGLEWLFVQGKYRVDYREKWEGVQAGKYPPDTHRWFLWEMENRFGRPTADFIPSDLPQDETPAHPGTQFTDDFETDSSADYTAECGTFTVDSGGNGYLELASTGCASGTGNIRDNTALGSNDMYAEVTIDTICGGGSFCGAAINMESGGDDVMIVIFQGSGGNIEVYTYIAGFSLVQTCATSTTHTTADSYGVRRDADNSIHCFKNSVEQGSPGSESTLTQTNFAGVFGSSTSTDYEEFFWDDFISAGARRVFMIQ